MIQGFLEWNLFYLNNNKISKCNHLSILTYGVLSASTTNALCSLKCNPKSNFDVLYNFFSVMHLPIMPLGWRSEKQPRISITKGKIAISKL